MITAQKLIGRTFEHPESTIIPPGERLYFIFSGTGELFLHEKSGEYFFPSDNTLTSSSSKHLFFGSIGNLRCIITEQDTCKLTPLPFRDAMMYFGDELFPVLARAHELYHWNKRSMFCGKCGSETSLSAKEFAKKCLNCGELYFPVLSPATITAVTNDGKILLATNSKFRKNLYSIIAGFVEAGESLEDCVKREIYEEVGIKVKNIKYFDSQTWPFPNSLMVGFTAEYESGELKPDGKEIIDAQWFTPDKLPELPSNLSISRKIIDKVIRELQ